MRIRRVPSTSRLLRLVRFADAGHFPFSLLDCTITKTQRTSSRINASVVSASNRNGSWHTRNALPRLRLRDLRYKYIWYLVFFFPPANRNTRPQILTFADPSHTHVRITTTGITSHRNTPHKLPSHDHSPSADTSHGPVSASHAVPSADRLSAEPPACAITHALPVSRCTPHGANPTRGHTQTQWHCSTSRTPGRSQSLQPRARSGNRRAPLLSEQTHNAKGNRHKTFS